MNTGKPEEETVKTKQKQNIHVTLSKKQHKTLLYTYVYDKSHKVLHPILKQNFMTFWLYHIQVDNTRSDVLLPPGASSV